MMNLTDIDTAARDIVGAYHLTADNTNRDQRMRCIRDYFEGGDPDAFPDDMTLLRVRVRVDQLIEG